MRRYWPVLVVLPLLVLWWAFSRGETIPTIHFASVRRATIENTVSTNGKAEPVQWAAARAQTAGVVRTVSVERGQSVSAGQPLVALDPTAAQSDLASALARNQEAQVEESILTQGGKAATLASLNDSIASARTAVEIAQRNLAAMERLARQQAATKLQLQNARDLLEKAKLDLLALENQKKTLVTATDRSLAEAKLRDAQAAVSLARHRVTLGSVPAPLSGILYQFDLRVGAYLQPGDLVGLVGNLDQMKVTVYVDEPDLGRVSLGMPVSITWDARPGRKWWGRVDKLPTEVVALGTRTVGEVSTIIDNPEHNLLPGVSVNATILSKVVKDALIIPKSSLRNFNGVSGTYKQNGKQLLWTPLNTGVSDVNNVQVLSGLSEGDFVADRVVDPSDAEIRNGMRVKPVFN
jgi:HlyD family secretion protein